MMIRIARSSARICLLLFGILLILLALLTLAARLGLPFVAGYKSDIEARVSDYLQSPVAIGQLDFRWKGFGPMLYAENVSVIASSERQVTLDELLIDLDLPGTLLRGIPVINEMTLVGADLAFETTLEGNVLVHGMEQVPGRFSRRDRILSAGQRSGGLDLLAWLFNARKVGLLDTQLTFIDRQAKQRLVMHNINIRAENNGDLHQLRIDLDLPESLGGSLEAGIDLDGSPRDLASVDGDIYIKSDSIKTLAWTELFSRTPLMPENLFQLDHVGADIGFEVWGRWQQGQVRNVRGQFTARQLVDNRREDVLLDVVTGDLSYRRGEETVNLDADSLVFVSGNQQAVINDVSLVQSVADQSVSLAASGKSLPLSLVSNLIAAVMTEHEIGRKINEAVPSGMLSDWQVSMGNGGAEPAINVTAKIDDFTLKSTESSPGFGPIDGSIELTNGVGSANLSGQLMHFDWPQYYQNTHNVDRVEAKLDFDLADASRLQVAGLVSLDDDGIDTETRFGVIAGKDRSLHLDVQSRFSLDDAAKVKDWMPLRILPRLAQTWFQDAFPEGRVDDGSLIFFGRPSEFPFEEGEGVFRAAMDVDDLTLSFLPTWPVVSDMKGRLNFNGLGMTGVIDSARMDSLDVTQAMIRINDLTKTVVNVGASGRGKLPEMVSFANTGPLRRFLEPALGSLDTTGNADMDIAVTVPLTKSEKTIAERINVNGSIFLQGNTLSVEPASVDLKKVRGAVNFDENGIRINNLKAHWLGRSVAINGRTRGQGRAGTTSLNLQGALKASDVLVHYENTLDQFVRGTSNWNVDLVVPHSTEKLDKSGISLTVTSDLVGTALTTPAPLSKSSASSRNFELQTNIPISGSRQLWNIDYNNSISAIALVEQGKFKALSAGLGGAAANKQLEDGIRLDGFVSRASLGDWVDAINQYRESLPGTGDREKTLPISGSLSTSSLMAGRDNLGPATLRINSDDVYLNAVVNNAFIRGSIRYPRLIDEQEIPAKVRVAYIDRRVLAAFESDDKILINGDDSAIDPRSLPPFEARISELKWDSLILKDVNLKTRPDVLGLNIDTLGFANRNTQLVGRGHWRLRDAQGVNSSLDGQHVTRLNLTLQSDDFGTGLSEMGFPGVLADGAGIVETRLSWDGPAYKPDLSELGGSLSLDLERGQIVQLEPGAGKIFGLFALQAIPRRLEFDFKDVTTDGLSFNRIAGDVSMKNGVADARLIQLTGPIGVIDVIGKVDLVERQYDQQITVLPRVSSALPVIGVIAGGASAGVGALVAGGILKALGVDLDRIGLREFNLTGSWDSPVMTPIPFSNSQRQ